MRFDMAMSRAVVTLMMIGACCAVPMPSDKTAGKPSLMSIVKHREEPVGQDSYLEALEYLQHNSAALQAGESDGDIGGSFRSIQNNAVSDVDFSRTGIAAAEVAGDLTALLSSLALGRRRRDFGGFYEGKLGDVVTSDECIERLVCELGSVAKNIYYKDSVLRVMNYFAPASYKDYLKTLKSAAYIRDASKCRVVKCNPVCIKCFVPWDNKPIIRDQSIRDQPQE